MPSSGACGPHPVVPPKSRMWPGFLGWATAEWAQRSRRDVSPLRARAGGRSRMIWSAGLGRGGALEAGLVPPAGGQVEGKRVRLHRLEAAAPQHPDLVVDLQVPTASRPRPSDCPGTGASAQAQPTRVAVK